MSDVDYIALTKTSLAASTGDVTGKVRQIHLAVARNSYTKAREELSALEITLKAHEAQLAIDGVGPVTSAQIEVRGRGIRQFCETVRARGGLALTEEVEDLPALRALWVIARAAERLQRAA